MNKAVLLSIVLIIISIQLKAQNTDYRGDIIGLSYKFNPKYNYKGVSLEVLPDIGAYIGVEYGIADTPLEIGNHEFYKYSLWSIKLGYAFNLFTGVKGIPFTGAQFGNFTSSNDNYKDISETGLIYGFMINIIITKRFDLIISASNKSYGIGLGYEI